mmetsp:Transcript_11865/g.21459  ORF Transcript_11865/g.21459 Transcript_11865/m.21459 type:complete len:207 (-) Transcript_11865:239-859(-)
MISFPSSPNAIVESPDGSPPFASGGVPLSSSRMSSFLRLEDGSSAQDSLTTLLRWESFRAFGVGSTMRFFVFTPFVLLCKVGFFPSSPGCAATADSSLQASGVRLFVYASGVLFSDGRTRSRGSRNASGTGSRLPSAAIMSQTRKQAIRLWEHVLCKSKKASSVFQWRSHNRARSQSTTTVTTKSSERNTTSNSRVSLKLRLPRSA